MFYLAIAWALDMPREMAYSYMDLEAYLMRRRALRIRPVAAAAAAGGEGATVAAPTQLRVSTTITERAAAAATTINCKKQPENG